MRQKGQKDKTRKKSTLVLLRVLDHISLKKDVLHASQAMFLQQGSMPGSMILGPLHPDCIVMQQGTLPNGQEANPATTVTDRAISQLMKMGIFLASGNIPFAVSWIPKQSNDNTLHRYMKVFIQALDPIRFVDISQAIIKAFELPFSSSFAYSSN